MGFSGLITLSKPLGLFDEPLGGAPLMCPLKLDLGSLLVLLHYVCAPEKRNAISFVQITPCSALSRFWLLNRVRLQRWIETKSKNYISSRWIISYDWLWSLFYPSSGILVWKSSFGSCVFFCGLNVIPLLFTDHTIKIWRLFPFAEEALAPLMTLYCQETPKLLSVAHHKLCAAFHEPATASYNIVVFKTTQKSKKLT